MGFSPIFEKGLILKQNMLEALRDYPYDFVNTLFLCNGDGIITGLDIVVNEDRFTVSPGIVKINGEVLFLTSSTMLEFQYERNYVYIETKREMVIDGAIVTVGVTQKPEEDSDLFEIFRYVRNATVKSYLDIVETYQETMNRIDQSMSYKSIKGGCTLCDVYYELFAKYILKSPNASFHDIGFAYQCLNGIDNIEILKAYFQTEDVSNKNMILCIKKKVQSLEVTENINKVAEPERKLEKKMIIS